jgi:hypothetical protein
MTLVPMNGETLSFILNNRSDTAYLAHSIYREKEETMRSSTGIRWLYYYLLKEQL